VRDQAIAAEAQGFSGFPGDKFPGLFAVYAVPLPDHSPDEMRSAIHKNWIAWKNEDITDEELARFKTRTRADLLRGLANNEGLARQLAEYQTRFGDWRQLFRQLQKIDAVSKADVRRVANKIFIDSNRTSARIEFAAPKRQAPGLGQGISPAMQIEPPTPTTNRTPGVRNEDEDTEDTKDTNDAFRCCPPTDSALYSRRQGPERTSQTGAFGQAPCNCTAVEEDCDSSAACVQTSAAAAHRARETDW